MIVKTAKGKEFEADRCYVDWGTLQIGIANTTIPEVLAAFSDPSEAVKITSTIGDAVETFSNYTTIALVSVDASINGVYLVLKEADSK
jgi:hypothetical protein